MANTITLTFTNANATHQNEELQHAHTHTHTHIINKVVTSGDLGLLEIRYKNRQQLETKN